MKRPAPHPDAALVARATAMTLPLGPVLARRMFGGFGLYLDGAMFAIVSRGVLYLKADATTAPRFEAAGAVPFTYDRRGRAVSLSFRTLPAGSFETMDAFLPWAEIAVAAARRAKRATSTTGAKRKAKAPNERRRRGFAP